MPMYPDQQDVLAFSRIACIQDEQGGDVRSEEMREFGWQKGVCEYEEG